MTNPNSDDVCRRRARPPHRGEMAVLGSRCAPGWRCSWQLGVAGVVALLSLLQVRLIERTVETQLVDSATATAQAVADGMRPLDETDIPGWLHEFIEAEPAVRAISIVSLGQRRTRRSSPAPLHRSAPKPWTWRRTGQQPRAACRWPGIPRSRPWRCRSETREGSWRGGDGVDGRGRSGPRQQARMIALWFAAPTVLILTLLVDLLARRLIHRRVAVIVSTMHTWLKGSSPPARRWDVPDELGSVAAGLNEMLERMEHFSIELQRRVATATTELRDRNVELEDSYRRVVILRDALARAERMAAVGQMAANVAHQVGTPLNLISGYVQMVRESNADPRTRERLEIVERQIQQVTGVLAVDARSRQAASPRERVDVARVVRYACETAQSQLALAGVELRVQLDGSLPSIEADATQLELVLSSTSSRTAWTRCPTAARSRFPRRRSETGVQIEVADTGSGHSRRDAGARVRAVGDQQDRRPGNGPGPGDRARSHRGARRHDCAFEMWSTAAPS